jgi:endonuclease/exonuclease/phosphatase family metal-dependent hydrolase
VTARRRAAALALAVSGLACAQAVNYLDPSGPLHTVSRDGASLVPRGAADVLRVVSFNVAYAIEIDRAIEVLRLAEPLRAPDVLALQEMDAPGAERIARALAMNAVYFPSGLHPKHRRDFGCAVLSPWPLEEPRKVLLPHAARGTGLRRAATGVTVVWRGRRLRVYSVHLPSPQAISGGSRRAQLRALAADAAGAAGPVVIAGDFNSHDKVEELARGGFDWITRDAGATARFRLFGLPLAGLAYDHVLVRGLRRAPIEAAVGIAADNRGASDHWPVWAVLVLPDAASSRSPVT